MGMTTPGFNRGMQVQPLQLRPDGCGELGIVLHELGHALGMAHEQSRPDRDQSVTIHWQNVQQGFEDQFEVDNGGYTNQNYDYMSVMHYGSSIFSANGQATITTPQHRHDATIGQRVGYSQYDVNQLADMYRETNSACIASQIDGGATGCADSDPNLCSGLTKCADSAHMEKCCACGGGFEHRCYEGKPCSYPEQLAVESHGQCVADRTSMFGGRYSCVVEQLCDYTVRVRCPSAPNVYWDYEATGGFTLPPAQMSEICQGACTITSAESPTPTSQPTPVPTSMPEPTPQPTAPTSQTTSTTTVTTTATTTTTMTSDESHKQCIADRTSWFGGAYSCVTEQVCGHTVRVQCPSAPNHYWDYQPHRGCCQLPPTLLSEVCDGACTVTPAV